MRAQILNRQQGEERRAAPGQVMISISTPGDKPASLQEGWESVLRLQFHDVVEDHPDADTLVLFNDEMAATVREFIRNHLGKGFVIHCDAGVSRSMAVGVFLRDVCKYKLQVFSNDPTDHDRFANQFANALVVRKLKEKVWREHLNAPTRS